MCRNFASILAGKAQKAEKVKRVDCVEAERIMYIIDQFCSRLLLIGGLQGKLKLFIGLDNIKILENKIYISWKGIVQKFNKFVLKVFSTGHQHFWKLHNF